MSEDRLGEVIKQHGAEDTADIRRRLLRDLRSNDYGDFKSCLPVSKDEFHELKSLVQED